MMKRKLACLLVLVLVLSFAVPALATEVTQETDPKTATVPVSYVVASKYTVTIPSETVTPTSSGATLTVSLAQGMLLEAGKKLDVSVAGIDATDFKVASGANTLAYQIKDGANTIARSGVVLTQTAGTTDAKSVDLSVVMPETSIPAFAGTYTDTLTFTVAVNAVA